MTKKKKSSLAEDLIKLAAALPWWLGCIAAMLVYFVLHKFAIMEIPAPNPGTGQLGSFAVKNFTKAIAGLGQYLVPSLLLIGSVLSILGRRKRESLVRNAVEGDAAEVVRSMSWPDFELFVGELFRLRGYTVVELGGNGADGGVDLRLKKEGGVFLAQCKHWRSRKVPVQVVRELMGVIVANGATGGIVVTSGVFTNEAQSFADKATIELIDGKKLAEMLPLVQAVVEKEHTELTKEPRHQAPVAVEPQLDPSCPRCGGEMVARIAKQGTNAGKQFLGCVEFPKCRGVRDLN